METLPMPLDAMSGASPGLAEFRVDAPGEIRGLLKQLADGNVVLSLSSPGGARCSATVWALDPGRGLLCLSAEAGDHRLPELLESDEIVAVGYLESIKLQFDLHDLVLVRNGNDCALNARFPRELYRLQRRNSFRVRPLINTGPTATLLHPVQRDLQLELRVLDVSIGGVALFLPDELPKIEPGVLLQQALVELDGDTRLAVSLIVHHVTLLHHESRGVRLGCEMRGLSGEGARALQCYIDRTQRRRRLLVL
ncbi:flagellar brake protein [Methylibium sp.]|uniref:flagellar brake protein n=1 Tax=Methylibium sp. TaxID=2067992 RepID=UPI0025DBEE51|nr:flagellar brake protein [Methylibium sp.]